MWKMDDSPLPSVRLAPAPSSYLSLLAGPNWIPLLPKANLKQLKPEGMVRTTWATSASSPWSPHLLTAKTLANKGSIRCYTAPGLVKVFLGRERRESSMAVTYLEVHLAQPSQFQGTTVAQWLARTPNSQQLSARPQGPLIAVERAHVHSSGSNEIELVASSLSLNVLKTVNGSELFGKRQRETSNGLVLTK